MTIHASGEARPAYLPGGVRSFLLDVIVNNALGKNPANR